MLKCKNVFWVENLTDLFCDFRIIPFKNMDLESQMNALTRLVFFIFIILLLFLDIKNSLMFFVISLTIIIIFYYIKRKDKMDNYRETFTNNTRTPNRTRSKYATPYQRANIQYNPTTGHQEIILDRPNTYTFCNDEIPFVYNNEYEVNKDYMSINQKLVGSANPKTFLPPVIVPPSHDLSYWKTNNLITHSHVNAQSQIDNYQSGYQVATCIGSDDSNMHYVDKKPELRRYLGKKSNNGYKKNNYQSNASNVEEYFETREKVRDQREQNLKDKRRGTKEDFKLKMPYTIKPNESGQVNVECGYDPNLLNVNLPTNYPAGDCEKNIRFKNYNKDIFTQIIQPGVYSVNQVNEPINSNIGISYTQQFEPVSMEVNEDGLTYVEHDPRLYTEPIEPYVETVNEANVYDPRFTGYGTSYRAYTDEQLGNTRFYYDDIDCTRMPNYITRSNIDFMKAADTYGPQLDEHGNPNTDVIRNLANNEFTRSALEFRTGLQEKLMRKINANAWQQKVAPLNLNVKKFSSR